MAILPQIKLDTTLSDLYASNESIAHIFCLASSTLELIPSFPRNLKYIYQEASFTQIPQGPKDQHSLAIKFLSLITQRDAFLSGPNSLVIFFYTGLSDCEKAQDIAQVKRTLRYLTPSQRPTITFCEGPKDVSRICCEQGVSALTTKVVIDAVAATTSNRNSGPRPVVDADATWYLNSKEALAESGLATPRAQIIELESFRPDDDWVERQILAIINAVQRRATPFVLKGNQSFGGSGTFVVDSDADRAALLQKLSTDGFLRRILELTTAENYHLRPSTFLITDMIQEAKSDIGLSFFVPADIESGPVFLGASEQLIDRKSSAWTGSKIIYSRQEELKKRLTPLMEQVATWARKHKYIGPAGVDILESREGELQVVDANFRTTGSLALPLMKTHFTSRGFDAASSFFIEAEMSRDAFVSKWEKEMTEGRLVVTAWYELEGGVRSMGDVVIGGESEQELGVLMEKIKEDCEDVTF